MFTGIVEELGVVKNFLRDKNGASAIFQCKKVLENTNIGDSICVNGVCETVVEFSRDTFSVRLSDETLSVTDLKNMKQGDSVNLERALTLSSRLGGHIVSGHIDCVGKLVSVEKLSDFYNLQFEIPENQTKYVVYKGSITVNGISLTVAKIDGDIFEVAIIPHTYENTNLRSLKIGDIVNIETDILAKYVEKLLSADDNKEKGNVTLSLLQENGFV